MSRALLAAVIAGVLLLSANVVEAVSSDVEPTPGTYSGKTVSFRLDADKVMHDLKIGHDEVAHRLEVAHGSDGWRFDVRHGNLAIHGRWVHNDVVIGSYGPLNDRRVRHGYDAQREGRDARAAATCHPPGVVKDVVVHSLTETRIGCPTAHVLVTHYFHHGTPPNYLCTKVPLGTVDGRLVCDSYSGGGFVALYRKL